MPIEPNQKSVSSLPSVISSIKNDRQVFRWFLMLISLPAIQQKLSLKNKTKEKYRALRIIQISKIVWCVSVSDENKPDSLSSKKQLY